MSSQELWLPGFRAQALGSVVRLHGLSRSTAGGILLDQEWNPCLLHWPVDSLPLSHQGEPLQLKFYLQPNSRREEWIFRQSRTQNLYSHVLFPQKLLEDQTHKKEGRKKKREGSSTRKDGIIRLPVTPQLPTRGWPRWEVPGEWGRLPQVLSTKWEENALGRAGGWINDADRENSGNREESHDTNTDATKW